MHKIVELKAENIKRLRAVSITPSGNVVVVGGRNAQGKSSVLDSIMYALAGGKTLPEVPVRRGAEKASVTLDLGEMVVRRTFTAAGGGALTVKKADGAVVTSPQAILDKLLGKIAFDPLDFTRMNATEQAGLLRQLVGLDFSKQDAKRAELYAARTDVGRAQKTAAARLAGMPKPVPGIPEVETDASEILAAQTEAAAVNRENDRKRALVAELKAKSERRLNALREVRERLAELQKLEANLAEEYAAAQQAAANSEGEIEGLVDVDLGQFQSKIQEAQKLNAAVRNAANYRKAQAEAKKLDSDYDRLTREIETLDEEKRKAIEAAEFPVPGLGFSGVGGVTLNGVPFDQASDAEKLKTSVAMGLAMNPTLRVLLIRDGSLLDEDSMKIVAELAAEKDAQVWIERVGKGSEVSVVIEDGMIESIADNKPAENETAAAAAAAGAGQESLL